MKNKKQMYCIFASLLVVLCMQIVAFAQQVTVSGTCWKLTREGRPFSIKFSQDGKFYSLLEDGNPRISNYEHNNWATQGNVIKVTTTYTGEWSYKTIYRYYQVNGNNIKFLYQEGDESTSDQKLVVEGTRIPCLGDPQQSTATAQPKGSAGKKVPSSSASQSNSQANDDQDDNNETENIATSDYLTDEGSYKNIQIQNDSKTAYIRITKLTVYDCVNVAAYDCGTKDVNIVLQPGGTTSVGTVGANDVISGNKQFSFRYSYKTELVNTPKRKPRQPRRKRN